MNPKDLLLPLFLALVTTWGLQYYFGRSTDTDQNHAGQQFQAPASDVVSHKPLNLEIDFVDAKSAYKQVNTTIETDEARYVFSTEGASLQEVEFKRSFGHSQRWLQTIFAPNRFEKEERCFLVAFDHMTPYYFDLKDHRETDVAHELVYFADVPDVGSVRKTFTIFKNSYRIDCTLGVNVVEGQTVQLRMFIVSPLLAELGKKDVVSGLVNDGSDGLTTIARDSYMSQNYWFRPTLFGTQDRYFVHSLVTDVNGFAQRGYFKTTMGHQIYPIIEGPAISQSQEWNLSFYMGPKIDDAMVAVDPRLEKTIYYGFLGPVSKWISIFMLNVLNWLNSFVYNYGLAIIILTILLRLLMFPFTAKTEQSVKKQQEFSKKLSYVQEKYKNNPDELNRARSELIQKHGMPGMSGCLPMLLQLPVFLALRDVLSTAIELYQAPFLWISDLSSPDPYYIFPILTAVAMMAQALTVSAQQRVAMMGMGLFFAAILANFSAGLALYISVSTILGVGQTIMLKRVRSA